MARQLVFIPLAFLFTTLFGPAFNVAQLQQPQTSLPPQFTVRLRATLTGHAKNIDRIAFSPDGKLVATSSEDFKVRLWDVETGGLKAILSGEDKAKWEHERWYYNWPYIKAHEYPDAFVGHLKDALENGASKKAISPDKQLIITVRRKDPDAFRRHDVMELWDVATGELKLTFAEIPHGISRVTWNPDGKSIIVEGSLRTKTRLMDVQTGRIKATLPYQRCTSDSWFGDSECAVFIFNADGSLFSKDKTPLKLWDSNTGQLVTELKSAHPPARFSPTDNRILATRSKDKRTALLWEVGAQVQSAALQERIPENKTRKEVPVRIRIKKEKEQSFKDLKNDQWAREFELELTNTGEKPIYYVFLDLVTDVKMGGTPLVFSLQYGRVELGDLVSPARSDDIPIKPNETYTFKLHPGQIPAWEQSVSKGRHPQATKLLVALQGISFGDGTGYFGNTPYP